ncbi:MAG: endonuclease/exonuclease/phosphatase family protein [Aggregatilineales bacterium]
MSRSAPGVPRRAALRPLSLYSLLLVAFLSNRERLPETALPPVALLNSFLHLLLKPAVIGLPLMLLAQRWRGAALLMPLATEFLRQYGGQLWRAIRPPQPSRSPRSLTALTYNLHKEDVHLDPILNVIRSANADVVALQELGSRAAECLDQVLANEYPYRSLQPYPAFPSAGQGLLSRFPLSDVMYWRHEGVHNALGHQRATLSAHGVQIALYNVHPVHPGMVGKLFDARPRQWEIDQIMGRLAAEKRSVLLLGDFNMTDQADAYRQITVRYYDVFRRVGAGMGYTFPAWRYPQARELINGLALGWLPPLFRIDYAFASEGIQALQARVLPDSGGSDHLPLWVEVAI